MDKITQAFLNVHNVDAFGDIDSSIHALHPLFKIISCLVGIVCILTTSYYDVVELLIYCLLIVVIGKMAKIKVRSILKRCVIGIPISLCLALSNLILMNDSIVLYGVTWRIGLLSFITILLKTILCLAITFILIATTKFNILASELVHIKVPAIFVLQLVMTYRYIFTLLEEARTMSKAYVLRHPNRKAIDFKDMGSFIGNLLVRSFKQSNDIYNAMKCRGFSIKTTYTQYEHFEIENVFLLMMVVAVMILVKVVF